MKLLTKSIILFYVFLLSLAQALDMDMEGTNQGALRNSRTLKESKSKKMKKPKKLPKLPKSVQKRCDKISLSGSLETTTEILTPWLTANSGIGSTVVGIQSVTSASGFGDVV